MTQPPMLIDKAYKDNFALYMRFVEMIPSGPIWDRDGSPILALHSDAVGYSLLEFFRLLIGDHWNACVCDGTPMWYLIQEDLSEAIKQIQEVMAQMQKIAPPRLQCGVTSRLDTTVDAATWAPAADAFALRHAVRRGEIAPADSPLDLAAFEQFIDASRVDLEVARALVDDVPHVAGLVAGDYAFYLWDCYPGVSDWIVVIEDGDAPLCYSLPPLSEWPTFARQGETYVP